MVVFTITTLMKINSCRSGHSYGMASIHNTQIFGKYTSHGNLALDMLNGKRRDQLNNITINNAYTLI